MTENTDFAQRVLAQVPETPPTFPMVSYDPDGDCIEFLLSGDSYYARRIDGLVTVYYSQETDEIVGSFIKGIRGFIRKVLQKSPGFRVDIHDGRIKLEHLFTARLWSESPDGEKPEIHIYRFLRDKAEQSGVEAEVGDPTEV